MSNESPQVSPGSVHIILFGARNIQPPSCNSELLISKFSAIPLVWLITKQLQTSLYSRFSIEAKHCLFVSVINGGLTCSSHSADVD